MAEPSTALVERDKVQTLVGTEIRTPAEFADKIRDLQGKAHILSPMSAVASIAPSHVINPMVVVIDPSVDPDTGRGADVYHQKSIHKGHGRGENYKPVEVSLNKIGLLKILSAFGVNVYTPTIEHRAQYWWIVTHEGDLLTFDGRYVRLPPGSASVDLRDGSADIGEWTPEAWAEAVRVANEQKKRVPQEEQWKIKPVVNGWTHERVMQQRKFGLELAETKSLNRLVRNLGVKQVYTIDELRHKPFVIFRASYIPDTSNPRVAEMLAAANLGARHLLFQGVSGQVPTHPNAPISHGQGDPHGTLEGDVVDDTTSQTTSTKTSAPPADAEEFTLEEPAAPAAPARTTYLVQRVSKRGKGADTQYFVEAQREHDAEVVTFYTTDLQIAQACATAAKDKKPREISAERISVQNQPYLQILEVNVAGGLKL